MESLLLFLLALPLALAAERLIDRFDRSYAADEQEIEPDEAVRAARPLPWQTRPWSDYLRRVSVLCLPPLAALAASRFDLLEAVVVTLFLAALLICTATDLLRYRVPNAVTYPAILLALALAVALPDADELDALLAALSGGGFFLVMAVLTRGGVGLGDVKLAALIGAILGLRAGYEALLLGVVAAGLIILALLLAGLVSRKQALPYAPFLALAAVVITLLEGPVFARL